MVAVTIHILSPVEVSGAIVPPVLPFAVTPPEKVAVIPVGTLITTTPVPPLPPEPPPAPFPLVPA